MWPSSTTSRHVSWGNENWKRHMYPNVHCSTIYKAGTWKQPRCPSTDEWMKKLWNRYVLKYQPKRGMNFELVQMKWMNLEPVTWVEVSPKKKKKQISCISACIWNLEKWYWWTHLHSSNRYTDIENRLVDTAAAEAGGMNWERSTKHM